MTNHAKVGGILSIISGAFGFAYFFMFIGITYFFQFIIASDPTAFGSRDGQMFLRFFSLIYIGVGLYYAILGVLAIIGGTYALRRKIWGLALAGAIAGDIIFSPTGIPALIFISLAKPEFATSAAPASIPVPPVPPQVTSSSAPPAA